MYKEKLELMEKAKLLAMNVHNAQVCYLSNEPKIYHIEDVVNKLSSIVMIDNEVLLAGYLHDVLDYSETETESLKKEIKETFGIRVLHLVEETTDNFRTSELFTSEGKKAFEERKNVLRDPGFSTDAAIITMVERISNLEAMEREIEKYGINYWNNFENNNTEAVIKEYYEDIYDILADRCIGVYRLRKLIDRYDYLLYKIFF